jgi:hypothetical protein
VHATNWVDVSEISRVDMLAALNVRYLVSSAPLDVPPTDYTLLARFADQPQFHFYEGMRTGPAYVYRNDRFLPRAFFATSVKPASSDAAGVALVEGADLRDTAVVWGPAAGESAASTTDRVAIRRASAGELTLDTANAARRFLVISEIWHPGWQVRVDGRRADLFRTDIALQGLWLDAGEHHVEIFFWPSGLSWGLAITAMTGGGVLVLVFLSRRRRQREP